MVVCTAVVYGRLRRANCGLLHSEPNICADWVHILPMLIVPFTLSSAVIVKLTVDFRPPVDS